jgi:peptide/nickel transport system substrate-binding protein
LINEVFEKQNFQAVLLGWDTDPDPDQYDTWHSCKTKPEEFNFIHYNNPKVDETLEKIREANGADEEETRKKQMKSCFDLQELLAEDQPYTFLFIPYALPVIDKRFRGVKLAPAGLNYNFDKWYVPKGKQIKYNQKCTLLQ